MTGKGIMGARFAAFSDLAADGLLADAGLDREALAAMGGSCRLFLGTLGHRQGAIRRDAVARLAGRQGEAMTHANDGIARLAARLGGEVSRHNARRERPVPFARADV